MWHMASDVISVSDGGGLRFWQALAHKAATARAIPAALEVEEAVELLRSLFDELQTLLETKRMAVGAELVEALRIAEESAELAARRKARAVAAARARAGGQGEPNASHSDALTSAGDHAARTAARRLGDAGLGQLRSALRALRAAGTEQGEGSPLIEDGEGAAAASQLHVPSGIASCRRLPTFASRCPRWLWHPHYRTERLTMIGLGQWR